MGLTITVLIWNKKYKDYGDGKIGILLVYQVSEFSQLNFNVMLLASAKLNGPVTSIEPEDKISQYILD